MKRTATSLHAALPLVAALLAIAPTRAAVTLTADMTQTGGPLKKAGLGSLFGVSSMAGGTPASLISGSLLYDATSQGRIGENGSNSFSTERVAPLLSGNGTQMMCRFNDLCTGFAPYNWPGYANWMNQVSAASQAVANNDAAVVYAIAPFNEPDTEFNSSAFLVDPQIDPQEPNATYDRKVNWLWTQTVQKIHALAPGVKIMGPNYFNYRPWLNSAEGPRMQAFLQNAIATGTSPNVIGWHTLGSNPGDAAQALTQYYRPLEAQLGMPNRPLPVSIEEYGSSTGDFEGVPGSIVKYWASFERAGIDFGGMGVYTTGGQLGNVLRSVGLSSVQPNGGWDMMNWYRQMAGNFVPVTGKDTVNNPQGMDGLASWDAASRSATVLLGGADDDADVHINGLAARGLGSTVRVRLDSSVWTNSAADGVVEHGGDPQDGSLALYDKILPLDASGSLTVPVHRVEGYNGYRIIVSPAANSDVYATKYEAENAALTHVTLHNGADALVLASGNGYIGGIDFTDSAVAFHVTVSSRGLYRMTVRYAASSAVDTASTPPTHALTVNGVSQGEVVYPYTTNGWSNSEMRTSTKLVALEQGTNAINFSKGQEYAELDFIDVRPDTHRYEAEYAKITDANLGTYSRNIVPKTNPNFVGGINNVDSSVQLTVEAPKAGAYHLLIGYANGLTGNATHQMIVNGGLPQTVTYYQTYGWLSTAFDPTSSPLVHERQVRVPLTLNAGQNSVVLKKGTGYAELDYITLQYP